MVPFASLYFEMNAEAGNFLHTFLSLADVKHFSLNLNFIRISPCKIENLRQWVCTHMGMF